MSVQFGELGSHILPEWKGWAAGLTFFSKFEFSESIRLASRRSASNSLNCSCTVFAHGLYVRIHADLQESPMNLYRLFESCSLFRHEVHDESHVYRPLTKVITSHLSRRYRS